MLEDEAAPETPDTPTVSEDTPEVDYRKRYEDLRPEFDRKNQALKDQESVWEDEQALLARIAEKYPHLIAEEEDVEEDDPEDEPEHLTKAEFTAWQDEQQAAAQARANEQQFTTDLNELVGDRELDDKGDAWIKSRTHKNKGDLQESVNAWFEYLDQLGGSKRKRKPSTPLPGGKTATGVPNYDDMTRDQINEAMVERARALEAQ